MANENKFVSNQRTNVNHFNYYYFTNAFTEQEIEEIIKIGESISKVTATTVGGDGVDGQVTNYRKSEVSWINRKENTKWIYDRISDLAIKANSEMWNFDIWDFQDDLQYTTYYGDGGHYDWHADLGVGISNRKLSIVLQLSDPNDYEGGDLQMNPGGNILTVPKEKGLICFFPSFMLHRVTPLTSGLRRSLVVWLCGANLR
jgi:PKHD-type hydroxylase